MAFLAAVSLAVMPTLSDAMAFAKGEAMMEICTPQGMKTVSAETLPADGETQPAAQLSMDHCDFCVPAAGAAPLPPFSPPWHMPTSSCSRAPAAFFHAPRTLFAWASAQPRAPPVLLA
jgi:hypothetical protein